MPAMLYGCLDALINATRPFLRSAEQRKWRAAEPQGCLRRRSAYLSTLVCHASRCAFDMYVRLVMRVV